MRKIAFRSGATVLACGLASLTLPATAQTVADEADATQRNSGIQDIIVTAQKREQNLQAVPISITALTADALIANRVQDVRDLSAIAPNLTVRLAAGGAAIPLYSMRGILTSGSAAGTDKGISLYLDGVYIQNVQGSVMEFADIERIEVLKGPQGTLFGRNATGGAISIITHDPSGKFRLKQDVTIGNENQLRLKTAVDLPRFGPASVSFTYLHSEHRGDTRNLGEGTVWNYGPASGGYLGQKRSPRWLGSDNVEAGTAAVKLDLHPDVDVIYKFDYSENHFTPNATGVVEVANPVLAAYTSSPNPMTPISMLRPDAVNNSFSTPGFTRSSGHNLTVKWRANDHITFKNILAFRNSRIDVTYQLDGLGGLVVTPQLVAALPFDLSSGFAKFVPTAQGYPFVRIANNGEQFEKQWSNEFQANFDYNAFNLTAGYIHFHDRAATGGFEQLGNTQFNSVIWGGTFNAIPAAPVAFQMPSVPLYRHTQVSVNSDAVFVQPEFHLSRKLDLILGARLTRDRKTGVEYSPTGGSTAPIDYDKSEVSVLAGINYRPTDNVLAYAKYATGYISGGRLATIDFAPEKARSFEVGIKTDLFDRHLRSNLAAFRVNYKALQFTTSGVLTNVPSAAPYAQAVVSPGDAKAWGFEWENTAIPFDGLTLGLNIGYTDFTQIANTATAGTVTPVGDQNRALQRPDWTGNGSVQYETPEFWNGAKVIARLDANFRGKTYLAANVTTNVLTGGVDPQAPVDPILNKASTVKSSWIVNGRLALAGVQVAGTTAQVALWSKNIFDNRKITILSLLPGVASAIYERARTFGLDFSVDF